MLVYQDRNAPGWGRTQPHAFGHRHEVEVEVDRPVVHVVDLAAKPRRERDPQRRDMQPRDLQPRDLRAAR